MVSVRLKTQPMKPLIAWALLIFASVIIWVGVYKPLATYTSQQKTRLLHIELIVKKQRSLLNQAKSITTDLKKVRLEKENIKLLINSKHKNSTASFQSMIRKLASNTDLTLTRLKVHKPNSVKHFILLSMQLDGEGTIKNIRDFLIETSKVRPIIRVDSLDLVSVGQDINGTRLNVSVGVSALVDNNQ